MRLDREQTTDLNSLEGKLKDGAWRDATATAGRVIDYFFSEVHLEIQAKSSLPKQGRVFGLPAFEKRAEKRNLERMTLGDRIDIFIASDLFSVYQEIRRIPLPAFTRTDWKEIVRIRNLAAHPKTGENPPTREEAHFIVSAARLLALELAGWSGENEPVARNVGRALTAIFGTAIVLVFAFFILLNWNDLKMGNEARRVYGSELSNVFKSMGRYDFAIWALEGDPGGVEDRDQRLFQLYKLEANRLRESDALGAYLRYGDALRMAKKETERLSIASLRGDVWDEMSPGARWMAQFLEIRYQPQFLCVQWAGVAATMGVLGLLIVRLATRKRKRSE